MMTVQQDLLVRSAEHPIIVFDGDCVFCSANAQFVLRNDHHHHFRLAAMQGEVGTALYERFGIDPKDPESMIVVTGDNVQRDSDGVLAIYSGLGWPWRAAAIFRVVPKFIRDSIYGWIARNRYRLFGRREQCFVPTDEHKRYVL
jgi:predicted DCC family thiol-disulfide oxidoreductase YuxK